MILVDSRKIIHRLCLSNVIYYILLKLNWQGAQLNRVLRMFALVPFLLLHAICVEISKNTWSCGLGLENISFGKRYSNALLTLEKNLI